METNGDARIWLGHLWGRVVRFGELMVKILMESGGVEFVAF